MKIPDIKISNILFPTDLSDNARFAFAYAVSLANLYKAKITLLHVLPEDQEVVESHIVHYVKKEKWNEIKKSHYQQPMETLTGKIRHHALTRQVQDTYDEEGNVSAMDDEIIIEHGKPAKVILEQIEKHNCDLVVMGSRGRSTLTGAIMGGKTEKVLKRTHVPVLVVRLPEDD